MTKKFFERTLGKFRGLPVYLLQYSYEYQAIESNEEKLYVFENNLFYHGAVIGNVEGSNLTNFDEDTFNQLRAKGWYQDGAEALGRVTNVAETRPQEEETPVSETVETGDSIVDNFMASWRDNIDNEVAKLQAIVKNMEVEICATNKI